MLLSEVQVKYDARIRAFMEKIRAGIEKYNYGVSSEICDYDSDNDYVYTFEVWNNPNLTEEQAMESQDVCDIQFYILDSQGWDGTANGTSWRLSCTHYGGAMGPECSPYNYTDKVWIMLDDPNIVELLDERFGLIDNFDIHGTVESIIEFCYNNQDR